MKRWALKYNYCINCGTKESPHYGRGYCISCYNKLFKTLMDKKYREKHKKELSVYFKKYNIKNKEKKQRYDYERRSKLRFNGLDKIALEKADYKCSRCGIGNDEHIKKYNSRLNVHHKDNLGRGKQKNGEKPNNLLENLVVLCVSCHTIIGNKTHQNYADDRMYKAWDTRRNKTNKIKL